MEAISEGIKKAYERIIAEAKKKGIEVIIYSVPKIPHLPIMHAAKSRRLEKKKEIGGVTDRLNEELRKMDVFVVDSNLFIEGEWARDKIHPASKAYERLYEAI